MTSLEDRIVKELTAERDLVPHASPGPLPRASTWSRYVAVAAGLLVLVAAGWMVSRLTPAELPAAEGVVVIDVSGDVDPEVVALWQAWWEAWAEVRAQAERSPGGGGSFTPGPLDELATDRGVAFDEISRIFAIDTDGEVFGVGVESAIELAPSIRVDNGHAMLRDCVFIDPIPFPALRQPASSGGTVIYTAEMVLTADGWRVSEFGTEVLIDQLTADEPCVPGETPVGP